MKFQLSKGQITMILGNKFVFGYKAHTKTADQLVDLGIFDRINTVNTVNSPELALTKKGEQIKLLLNQAIDYKLIK